MTRINTNISSLTAQQTLAASNNMLQTTLTRLSTGLRINSGADDPAGMIAAANLGSDIKANQQAISNSQVASQMISTADSALGQISTLLTNMQGLITQAANTAAMSSNQIAANQLQIDSSLAAIDRISQTTAFQGQNLLDGSLGFVTGSWTGTQANVSNLQINQANLSSGALSVSVDVTGAAQQAQLDTAFNATTTQATTGHIGFSAGGWLQLAANAGTAADGSAGNGYTLNFVESASVGAATPLATLSGKTITVYVNDAANTTLDNIKAALQANSTINTDFAVTDSGSTATDVYTKGGTDASLIGTTGTSGSDGGLAADSVFELSGNTGSQVFNFKAGTTIAAVKAAINLATTTTGVSATNAANILQLKSVDYGSSAFVNVNTVSGSQAFTLSDDSTAATRATGTDIAGTVNGTQATGAGQNLSLNTTALSLSANISATGTYGFAVQSGGALFQIGPQVVGSQQAQIGIQSVSTGSLGGTSGRLYQLGSGQNAALATDPLTASKIVQQALDSVTSLRGRLGAFQSSTIDSNISALTDAVTNLTAAQSTIQDADFAAESANLTRAQILVQSGTSVLSIANKNPENVLSLLR